MENESTTTQDSTTTEQKPDYREADPLDNEGPTVVQRSAEAVRPGEKGAAGAGGPREWLKASHSRL